MDLQVVGMRVDPTRVVVDQDIRPLLAADRGQPVGRVLDITGPEGQRVVLASLPATPESRNPRNRTASTASNSAAAWVSASRRSAIDSPAGRGNRGVPSSPFVAVTSTTRHPAAASRAIVPPVKIASSSGWACRKTMVVVTPRSSQPRSDRCTLDRTGFSTPPR